MALKQELILLILIYQQFCILWTHKGYHRTLSQNIFLCAYHDSTISVRSFKVGYHSALVMIMPRNLLFQSNVFLHPCCMLKSSERAKLTNYSTKATSQIFTDLFLFVISMTWHFSSLNTEVKAKGVMLQQLLQIFCRLKWKKKKVFFSVGVPCRQHDSQSRIQCSGSDRLDLNRSQHTPLITCRELSGKRVHFFVHHFLV